MSELAAKKPVVLIVDDSRVIRLAAKKMLGGDYDIELAEDGLQGWAAIEQNRSVSVVFTDLSMPNMNGMALLQKVRESDDEHIAALPVIILTGAEDDSTVKQEAMDAGATDFILKPFDSIDLTSRARAYASLSRKVEELEETVSHDRLTGLYNARALDEQGKKAVSFAQRHKLSISLCVVEIQDFQALFLQYGKKAAQTILVTVVKRLQASMREEDIAARVDLCKFVLVLPLADASKARAMVERIQQTVRKLVFDVGSKKIQLALKFGCTTAASGTQIGFSELYQQAEEALSSLNVEGGAPGESRVACYHSAEQNEANSVAAISAEAMAQAMACIAQGDFDQVPAGHVNAVMNQLSLFMQHIDAKQAGQDERETGQ